VSHIPHTLPSAQVCWLQLCGVCCCMHAPQGACLPPWGWLLHVGSTGSAPLRLLCAAVFGGSPFATEVWRELQVEAQDSMQLAHQAPWVHSMHRAWRASWALQGMQHPVPRVHGRHACVAARMHVGWQLAHSGCTTQLCRQACPH
jgi:hypothetical protein